MAKSRTQLRQEVKDFYTKQFMEYLAQSEDVLQVKQNELAFPITDSEGNEDFIKITISIPTGSNKGTEPYDAYNEAQCFQEAKQLKIEKAKALAEQKAKKIARDTEYRKKKQEQLANRENA